MARFDIGAAKREAALEAEPIELVFPDGSVYTVPGSMPAEFELEQQAIGKDLSGLADGDPAPPGTQDRILRAVFGQQYDEMQEKHPPTDLMVAMQFAVGEWLAPFQNPNGMSQRVRAAAKGQTNSRGSSTTTSTQLRPISKESMASTSPAQSGSNGSVGEDSPPSTQGSRRTR